MRITDRRGYITLIVFVASVIVFAVGTYYLTSAGRYSDPGAATGTALGSSNAQ